MKVKNITSKVQFIKLDGKFISVESNEVIEMPIHIFGNTEGFEIVQEEIMTDTEVLIKEGMLSDLPFTETLPGFQEEVTDVIEEDDEEEADIEEDVKDENGKYSKTDLKDKNKTQQLKILQDFGLTKEEIKLLKNEKQRVEKILELQK